jgi:hypothetical protein
LRFYVSPAELTLICNELEWLGRVLRDGKVLIEPSYFAISRASRRCKRRRTRARFSSIGWLAGKVPRLAEVRQPLVGVLVAADMRAPTESMHALAGVPLSGLWLGP